MRVLAFNAIGEPQAKGSLRAFTPKGWNRPILTSTNKGLKAWEGTVQMAAQWVADGTVITGPVVVTIRFFLSRPASLPKKIREHVRRPDLDKLVRGSLDALNKVIWEDDSQVVQITATKRYVSRPEEAPRAEFEIHEIALVSEGPVEKPAALFT